MVVTGPNGSSPQINSHCGRAAGRQHEHEHFIQVRGSKLQKLFNIKVKSIHLVNSSAIIGYPEAM